MSSIDAKQSNEGIFVTPSLQWLKLAALGLIFVVLFLEILTLLTDIWLSSEEYSHGILIPLITAFLIWQKQNDLSRFTFEGSVAGLVLFLSGLALLFLGELSSLQILVEYSVVVTLMGGTWAIVGDRIFSRIWLPVFFLFFAVPLPQFLYQGLSAKLQLLSSQLGVSVIRLCDISVYLEGNVIDLGAMKLQVVEACSGLRYLFPLMSLAFMCAYFFNAAWWKRAVIFLSSIPITILMNSFRIGLIGVTVEYWGKEMAEGFLHDFEGWFIFMACTTILVGEMWLLARISRDPRPLRDVFGLTFPEPVPEGTTFRERQLPMQFWAVGGLLIAALGLSQMLGQREEIVPARAEFREFPLELGDWRGRRLAMEQEYIDALKFDDYIMADYVLQPSDPQGVDANGVEQKAGSTPVNFYSAFYGSQRKGESIHSPRSCIPGGGWQIMSLDQKTIDGSSANERPLEVNRLLIQKGEDRQLVYYWFEQRGRHLTNEYLVKWYLFWDALTMNRSDGALVRLITMAPKGEDIEAADQRLTGFLGTLGGTLGRFIPQ